MDISDQHHTTDRFLDGRLLIRQPVNGYRAGTDPVLLAAAVSAVAGQSVLELGCGVGVASLCLGRRIEGLIQTGVEIQSPYAELARQNALANAIDLTVINADLARLPDQILAASYDHVIANPPYLSAGHGTKAADDGKDTALREKTALARWVDVAVKRLRPKGVVTLIISADRVPQILQLLEGRTGSIRLKPLSARTGKPAGRVIVRAQKGSRGSFRLCAPLILHDGARHLSDQESFGTAAQSILRGGCALEF